MRVQTSSKSKKETFIMKTMTIEELHDVQRANAKTVQTLRSQKPKDKWKIMKTFPHIIVQTDEVKSEFVFSDVQTAFEKRWEMSEFYADAHRERKEMNFCQNSQPVCY